MKQTISLTLLMMSFSAFSAINSISEDILKVLPKGDHVGGNCNLKVGADSRYISMRIYSPSGSDIGGFSLNENSSLTKIQDSYVGTDNFSLKYTVFPDDQYSGKDVITVSYANKLLSIQVKDYGPLGIFFERQKYSCKLK